jgi:hypothetical protein
MDLRFKHILFALTSFLSSCDVEFEDLKPVVSVVNPITPIQTRQTNFLSSDFLNWDSVCFKFLRYNEGEFFNQNCQVVFLSNNAVPDTLILSFFRIPYNASTPYYCGNPSCYASVNKYSASKIISTGSGKLIYDQLNEDSADLVFDLSQNSNYRLPDNTLLKAGIKGRLRVPHKKM